MVRQTVRSVGMIKKRQAAKYAIDVQREKDCTAMIGIFAFLRHRSAERTTRLNFLRIVFLFAAEVEDIQRDIRFITTPIERRYLRIDDVQVRDSFTADFRFRRPFIHRLLRCLRIPAWFELDNGAVVNGEEGLLIFLKRFAGTETLLQIEKFCGWEISRLSRIFKWVCAHIFRFHRHRVEDYLDWHVPYLPACRAAMQAKKRALHPRNLLNPRTENVTEAYDGLRIACCRPTGSSVMDANGNRIYIDLQAQIYNGHCKVSHVVIFSRIL